jgi:hypothetical protein
MEEKAKISVLRKWTKDGAPFILSNTINSLTISAMKRI